MPTTVVQARQRGIKGYKSISRPGPFGNPYKVGWNEHLKCDLTLDEALGFYKDDLLDRMTHDLDFRDAALALRGEDIGCPCPGAKERGPNGEARCHGHVLADVIDGWKE